MASKSPSHFHLSSTQTAIAIVVPSRLQPEINILRKIHDKAYRKWEPHINILYPFVDPSLLSSAVSALRTHLSSSPISLFRVKIEDVGTFEHRRNATVFLKPGEESEERICELRKQLVSVLGRDERDGTHDGVFRPHLTIGQAAQTGVIRERLVEKAGRLVGLEWNVERLAVLRREATGEMTVVDEISLRGLGDEQVEKESHFQDTGWRRCCHFAPEIGWNQLSRNMISPSKGMPKPLEVTIASYNLMSEPQAPLFPNRLPHLVEAISKSMPRSPSSLRVLCLQEVDEDMLPLLLEYPELQQLFPFSTHNPSSLLPSKRNLVTLSTHPFSCYTIQFLERHKSALIVSFYELPVQVANVHLTSALSDEAVAAKKTQMENLTKFLVESQKSNEKNIFVAGDFNIATSSKTIETALSQKVIAFETYHKLREVIDIEVWDDAFVALQSHHKDWDSEKIFDGEEGATFDRLTNQLASMSKTVIDNRPQRYDRVLFKRGAQILPLHFEIFGRPNGDGTCWSDHFGICATFQIDTVDETGLCAKTEAVPQSVERIRILEDSTDIQSLINPYLPTGADRKQREAALALLQKTLSQSESLADLILAPLGSYCMDTYFVDSDVDVLAIALVSPRMFFDFAIEQLRALDTREESEHGGFKGVHFVNSLVSIIEVNVLGIKFDIQYCQAPELVKRYNTQPPTPLQTLIFDPTLINTLTPSSLRPLNTYRDTAYLLNTLPSLPSYRLAHRFLSLYLKSRGLYSAKFGYLGGIHLSLLLNRVIKLITSQQTSNSGPNEEIGLSPATILRTFFNYYSSFNWANEIVLDPELENGNKPVRLKRDVVFIHALHTPTARPNVASSCTHLSALTISSEFALAAQHISQRNWEWCLRPKEDSVREFLASFGAFVRITLNVWDIDEISGKRVRDVVGWVESRVVRVMVSLGQVAGVEGRVWPARFCAGDENKKGKEKDGNDGRSGFQGYYLIGVSATEKGDVERKKVLTGKVLTAVREFERSIREAREVREGNVWVDVDVTPKKKVLEMSLVIDERDWGRFQQTLAKPNVEKINKFPPPEPTFPSRPQISTSKSLRPAQDIISRIKWDPALSEDDFLIGYEDRFVGVKEIELGKWKSEQTDEEFIPMHRIVWVRRKGDHGEKVWDRRLKVDLIFGSGVGRGSAGG